MAKEEEPHEVLGVKKNSTRAEIRDAYYQQAKQWHPDKNSTPYAAERFKVVQVAMRAMLKSQEQVSTNISIGIVSMKINRHLGPPIYAAVRVGTILKGQGTSM